MLNDQVSSSFEAHGLPKCGFDLLLYIVLFKNFSLPGMQLYDLLFFRSNGADVGFGILKNLFVIHNDVVE